MSGNISTLIGILVDVSGSMKASISDGVHEKGGAWVQSIFQVINDLIKHDMLPSNHVFAVAVGASFGNGVFDLLNTLDKLPKPVQRDAISFDETIDRILDILQAGGAGAVKKWATRSVIKRTVSMNLATVMLRRLQSDPDFVRAFVNDCLPAICRGAANSLVGTALANVGQTRLFRDYMVDCGVTVLSLLRPTKEEDIIDVVKKAEAALRVRERKEKANKLKDVSIGSSIFSVQKALDIIHGCVDEEQLTAERLQELMETVEPFIYGLTPLFRALEEVEKLFEAAEYHGHKKLLFVLSDGEPADGNTNQVSFEFKDADVMVVSCFITRSTQVEPKRLYSVVDEKWENGAKFLFALSSTMTTQLLPRTIFIKRGWKIEVRNNETKLFLQVNHPDIVKDACDLARNVVCCQYSLSDILVSVSLDSYINKNTDGFHAQKQDGSTCYANASAAVLHLSMKRILGRDGGYPDFKELRDDLIKRYGTGGANTESVLKDVCPLYRLQCQGVDIMGALRAVSAKRPVVATFHLTDEEWEAFSQFYQNNKNGVLTRKEIDITKRHPGVKTVGHAVVLTSYNSECLRLMNSWGKGFADMGFFRVQNADVIGLEFIDVFWTLNDLTNSEKAYHAKHGSAVAAILMKTLTGLQKAEYQCPLCRETSLVTEFTGQLLQATCPKCRGEFRSDEAGNILALNMYITSLSR